jgi:hypothetical protein
VDWEGFNRWYTFLGGTAGFFATAINLYDRLRKGPQLSVESCEGYAGLYKPGSSNNLSGPGTLIQYHVSIHVRNEGDPTTASQSILEVFDEEGKKIESISAYPQSLGFQSTGKALNTNDNVVFQYMFSERRDSGWNKLSYNFIFNCVNHKPVSQMISFRFQDYS